MKIWWCTRFIMLDYDSVMGLTSSQKTWLHYFAKFKAIHLTLLGSNIDICFHHQYCFINVIYHPYYIYFQWYFLGLILQAYVVMQSLSKNLPKLLSVSIYNSRSLDGKWDKLWFKILLLLLLSVIYGLLLFIWLFRVLMSCGI